MRKFNSIKKKLWKEYNKVKRNVKDLKELFRKPID